MSFGSTKYSARKNTSVKMLNSTSCNPSISLARMTKGRLLLAKSCVKISLLVLTLIIFFIHFFSSQAQLFAELLFFRVFKKRTDKSMISSVILE